MDTTTRSHRFTHLARNALVSGAIGSLLALFPVSGATAAVGDCPKPAGDASNPFTERIPEMDVTVNGTYVPLTGFFYGNDRIADIIWFSPTGADRAWKSTGHETWDKQAPIAQINGALKPIVGQFGDSDLDDILWYGPGSTPDQLWLSRGDGTFRVISEQIGGAYTPILLDSRAISDILWLAPNTSDYLVWDFLAGDGSFTARTMKGLPNAQAVVGDYTGDGAADVFWYRAGVASDALTAGSGNYAQAPIPQTVNGTYQPFAIDVVGRDSIARAEILWWSGTSSTMSLWVPQGIGTWKTCALTIATTPSIIPVPMRASGGPSTGAAAQRTRVHLWDPKGTDRTLDFNVYTEGAYAWRYLDNPHPTAAHQPVVYRSYRGSSRWLIWYQPGPGADFVSYPWEVS